MIENEIKSLCIKEGAIRVGIARSEAFSEAPPSANIKYEKPWANAVVSFAVPLGTEWIRDYVGKITRMVFKKKLFENYHKIYRIGGVIEKCLESAGFRAHNVIPNGIYRPDHTFEKKFPDQDVKPPISLRYMAVGAGVGNFGWSGNVLVPGHWSNVLLGAVITDAQLQPDSLLEEILCDNCRICVRVCPVGFMSWNEKSSVKIGGREHIYNKKNSDLRCIIGCGGYTGISKSKKWSSWSTGRITLPDRDDLLPDFYRHLRDNPINAMARRNMTFGPRGVLDRSLENTNPTCNLCMAVCSGPMENRTALMKLLFTSGIVEIDEQGREIVIR